MDLVQPCLLARGSTHGLRSRALETVAGIGRYYYYYDYYYYYLYYSPVFGHSFISILLARP